MEGKRGKKKWRPRELATNAAPTFAVGNETHEFRRLQGGGKKKKRKGKEEEAVGKTVPLRHFKPGKWSEGWVF